LQGVEVLDGPPQGPALTRIAIIQNHATKTWAVTAMVVHPGIGMRDGHERTGQGQGLSDLLDLASRTGLIDEILFVVRTVPDDGAERDLWTAQHRQAGAPPLSRQINDDLRHRLTSASVRTEAFVTIVIPEDRIGREARECGGGLEGRARVLYGLMGEVEAQMRGGMAMTQVSWLTSPQLALACRTGFAPADRAGIIDALAQREKDASVKADVPWAMAGPSAADPLVRHYSHDAWNSVSCTITLPPKGAVMGALAPVLTPAEAGERRSFMVAYPICNRPPRTGAPRPANGPRTSGRSCATKPRSNNAPAAGTKPPRPAASTPSSPAAGPSPARTLYAPSPSPRPPGSPSTAAGSTPRCAAPGSPRSDWTWPTTSALPPPPSPSASV